MVMHYSGQVITSGMNALLEGDEDNTLKEGDEHLKGGSGGSGGSM